MSIKSILEANRKSLDEINIHEVKASNPADILDVMGSIAERFVFEWLSRCGVDFDTAFPRSCNGTEWRANNSGVTVFRSRISEYEFDFVFSYGGRPYAAEVKSLKLNGVSSKFPRGLALAKQMYGPDVSMLLFFPIYTNKIRDSERIMREHPYVECIDLGYKKKQLDRVVSCFYTIRNRC